MSTKRDKRKFNIWELGEETINTIVFITGVIASVGACLFVIFFLDGSIRDAISLIAAVVYIIIRILEKKTDWFKKYAKYAYMTVPFWTTIILVVSNDGKFAAVSQGYLMFLALSTAYHEVKVVFFCAAVTVISSIGAFVLFPQAMLKLDEPIVWVYISSIYIMSTLLSAFIAKRMELMVEQTRRMKAYEDELVYLKQLEKKDEKQSEFIHNINHYFIAIGELARVEHCDQIVNLVEELNGKLLQNQRIIYTNHKVLNAILSEKVNEATEQEINFETYVEPGVRLNGVTDGDLVAMLCNLFDNAIEATEQCEGEKRKISLWIYMEKEGKVCVTKLVNHFVQPVVRQKSGFISTKKNREMHGIGIRSVENTAKKYGGHLQCLIEEDRFTSILILPVEK